MSSNHSSNSNSTEKDGHITVIGWIADTIGPFLFVNLFILFASLIKLIYHRLHQIRSYLPESLVLIVIGIGAGALSLYSFQSHRYQLTPEVFFLVLLPPIVLDSAYNLYNRTFAEMLGIVVIMALLGTILSFLLIGFSLYGLEMAGAMGSPSPTDCSLMPILMFSSLIVAVDPVAVLAIFKDLGVERELYFMVFGESLLNDAVTIVLYEIIGAFMELGPTGVTATNIVLGLTSFFTVSLGGLLIGVVMGLLSSLMTRFQSFSTLHMPILITIAYLSYLFAYSLKWSGIIAMIGCGIVQASYAFKNIPRPTQNTLRELVEIIAGISEAIIFVFLGFELLMSNLRWHWGFMIWSLVLCIVARFVVVLVLKACINLAGFDQRKISWTEFFVIFYGGLRGAVAFSLATLIPIGHTIQSKEQRQLFITATMLIILFTVAVMGTTMKPIARLLHVKTEKIKMLSLYTELNCTIIDDLMTFMEVLVDTRGRNCVRMYIRQLDIRYLRSWLVNNPYDNSSFKLLKRYEQISLVLHRLAVEGDQTPIECLDTLPSTLWPGYERANITVMAKKHDHMVQLPATESQVIEQIHLSRAATLSFLEPDDYTSMVKASMDFRLRDIVKRKQSSVTARPRINSTGEIYIGDRNLAYIDDEECRELGLENVKSIKLTKL